MSDRKEQVKAEVIEAMVTAVNRRLEGQAPRFVERATEAAENIDALYRQERKRPRVPRSVLEAAYAEAAAEEAAQEPQPEGERAGWETLARVVLDRETEELRIEPAGTPAPEPEHRAERLGRQEQSDGVPLAGNPFTDGDQREGWDRGWRSAEALAQQFHETYERLAPSFGYATRSESAVPWADLPEPNKRLMIATCEEIAGPPTTSTPAPKREPEMTTAQMFAEWRKGCTNTQPEGDPADCVECTRALVLALEKRIPREVRAAVIADNPCADALYKLWQDVILAHKPNYGDWEYPGQAYRHLLAEFNELHGKVLAERERCAVLAETMFPDEWDNSWGNAIAAAIRQEPAA